jgi:LemA protein
MTQEDLNRFQQAQDELGKSLGRLIAVSEAYPDLKANENFKDLQAQLEGTENRISVARQDFNKAAQAYNTSVRSFPKNIFASIFGFEKKAYFQAAAGSEEAPKVEF